MRVVHVCRIMTSFHAISPSRPASRTKGSTHPEIFPWPNRQTVDRIEQEGNDDSRLRCLPFWRNERQTRSLYWEDTIGYCLRETKLRSARSLSKARREPVLLVCKELSIKMHSFRVRQMFLFWLASRNIRNRKLRQLLVNVSKHLCKCYSPFEPVFATLNRKPITERMTYCAAHTTSLWAPYRGEDKNNYFLPHIHPTPIHSD